MKVSQYAKLIGRSEQFVRIACQQGQIPCIMTTGKTGRHTYEIKKEAINEQKAESNQEPNNSGNHMRSDSVR